MIIWHGKWTHETTSYSHYRVLFENGRYSVQTRRTERDEWKSEWIKDVGRTKALDMSGWYGMTARYDSLEILP